MCPYYNSQRVKLTLRSWLSVDFCEGKSVYSVTGDSIILKTLIINIKPSQKENINRFNIVDAIADIFVSLLLITLLRATRK